LILSKILYSFSSFLLLLLPARNNPDNHVDPVKNPLQFFSFLLLLLPTGNNPVNPVNPVKNLYSFFGFCTYESLNV